MDWDENGFRVEMTKFGDLSVVTAEGGVSREGHEHLLKAITDAQTWLLNSKEAASVKKS